MPSEIYIGYALTSAFVAVLGCMIRFAWGNNNKDDQSLVFKPGARLVIPTQAEALKNFEKKWKFKKEFGGGTITFVPTDEEPYQSADPEGDNICRIF